MKTTKHGGPRKGAGRKKGFKMKKSELKEKTTVLRVPNSLVKEFKERIKQHKKKGS